MQRSSLALVFALTVALAACEGRPLTGPEAQQAFARAVPLRQDLANQTLVLVNGTRLAPGQALDGLNPAQITRIEILKGAVARRAYG